MEISKWFGMSFISLKMSKCLQFHFSVKDLGKCIFNTMRSFTQGYETFILRWLEYIQDTYYKGWADIHMTPEQSLQAHLDLQGKVMVPVHNGTFDLSFHAWFEPLERVSKAADEHNAVIRTPIIGEIFNSEKQFMQTLW